MVKLIGMPAFVRLRELAGWKVAVVIEDVRMVYGRTDYFVKPADGGHFGQTDVEGVWVDAQRVEIGKGD